MPATRALGLAAEIRRRASHVVWPALGLFIVGYFAFHAVHGDRGILAWHRLDQKVAERRAELDVLRGDRRVLEHRVRLLHPDSLDLDLLDETARHILGYGHPDELIIRQGPDDRP